MARYVVEVEGDQPESTQTEMTDGLTVAKALARKKSRQSIHAVVVRDNQTGKVMARYEPPQETEGEKPTLANSVKRMRAANDRLKEALVPPAPGRKKRA
jgi:hypothetical protein